MIREAPRPLAPVIDIDTRRPRRAKDVIRDPAPGRIIITYRIVAIPVVNGTIDAGAMRTHAEPVRPPRCYDSKGKPGTAAELRASETKRLPVAMPNIVLPVLLPAIAAGIFIWLIFGWLSSLALAGLR